MPVSDVALAPASSSVSPSSAKRHSFTVDGLSARPLVCDPADTDELLSGTDELVAQQQQLQDQRSYYHTAPSKVCLLSLICTVALGVVLLATVLVAGAVVVMFPAEVHRLAVVMVDYTAGAAAEAASSHAQPVHNGNSQLVRPSFSSSGPICNRTLLIEMSRLHPVGFGSRVNLLCQAIVSSMSDFDNRRLFIRDQGWNYNLLSDNFLPPASLAPVLPGWTGRNETEVMQEMLYWGPTFATRPIKLVDDSELAECDKLPFPHVLHGDGFDIYPVSLATSTTAQPDLAYPLSSPCRMPHTFEYVEQGDNYDSAPPHVAAKHHYALGHPNIRPLTFPAAGVNFTYPPSTHAYLRMGSPAYVAERPLPIPQPLMFRFMRIIHQLLVLRPEMRAGVKQLFDQFGLRTRSEVRAALLRRINANMTEGSVYGEVRGSGSIALHVRRQDKGSEALPIPCARYLAEVENITSWDPEMYTSFPLLPTELQGKCGTHTRQVQILVVSDAPEVLDELRGLQPCYRFIALPKPANYADRLNEASMWTMGNAQRFANSNHFISELIMLSESDYLVNTLSSNVGRVAAVSRGWQDSFVEGRVRSLDEPRWFGM